MKKILLGVTIDDSLQFHSGLPEALVSDGWDVHIVATPGRRLAGLSRVPGITTHPISMERSPNPLRDLTALGAWLTLIRKVTPDVTFIGTPKASLLGNVAAWLLRVPRHVYVMHGLRFETTRGTMRKVLRAMEKVACYCATEVLAVSSSLREVALDEGLTSAHKLHVLGAGSSNGVEIQRHQALQSESGVRKRLTRSVGIRPDTPVIGFVGRLTRDKGLPELADALNILHRKGTAVQVLIVGGVDDATGQAALTALEATGQTIFSVGYQEDPAPYFTIMDVFCFPSLREGLPNVVLEAMASGVVVVASDATGLVDLVADGVTGFQVKVGYSDALARAIERAIENAEYSASLASNALQMVTERFERSQVQLLQRAHLARVPGR